MNPRLRPAALAALALLCGSPSLQAMTPTVTASRTT